MKKKYNIDLSTGIFKLIRESGCLYVDKSRFIENIINENSRVLLFTRPRRMGKTMNLTMLQSFFDMNEKNDKLFDGLYIKNNVRYDKRRMYPVLFLDFKILSHQHYPIQLGQMVIEQMKNYVKKEDFSFNIPYELSKKEQYFTDLIRKITANIEKITGKKTIILIDEYDKLFMDSIDKPEFEDIRSFVKTTMLSALKDNPHLEKAVITGVNRIAQESMFSDLNNLSVFDIFTKSDFDSDFGFSENEVKSLIKDGEEYETARQHYNNCRIGNAKVFFNYSVLSYLSRNELGNYWGRSGTMTRIAAATADKRLETITQLIDGFDTGKTVCMEIDERLNIEDLSEFSKDSAYYSFLIQTGYLTFNYTKERKIYEIMLPNLELKEVWEDFILDKIDLELNQVRTVRDILRNNPPARQLAYELQSFLNNRISYMDVSPYEPEFTYHMLVLGMMLGFGYACQSNREAGNGRFDILVTTGRQNIVYEFKSLDDEKELDKGAADALAQIREKKYFADIENNMPVYLAGIAFCGKVCRVGAELIVSILSSTICDER